MSSIPLDIGVKRDMIVGMAIPDLAGSGVKRVDYDKKLAGRRVRHAREDHDWSREDLAVRLTQRTPDRWSAGMVKFMELGRRAILPPLLRVLSEVLDRPADYFLYDDIYTGGRPSPNGHIPRYVPSGRSAPVIPISEAPSKRTVSPKSHSPLTARG